MYVGLVVYLGYVLELQCNALVHNQTVCYTWLKFKNESEKQMSSNRFQKARESALKAKANASLSSSDRVRPNTSATPLPSSSTTTTGQPKPTGNTTTADFGRKQTANEIVEEIERRHEVVTSETKQVPPPTALSVNRLDFEDPDQQWVVVNIAHKGQRPIRERPALRMFGAFSTEQDAVAYSNMAASDLNGCNMWKMKMRQWFLLCKTQDRQVDGEYSRQKVEALKRIHLADRARRDAEFAKNRETRKQGETEQSLLKQAQKLAREKKKSKVSTRLKLMLERKKHGGPASLLGNSSLNQSSIGTNEVPTQLIRRKQDHVVVSFMRDTTKAVQQGREDPEPACIVWRSFAVYEHAVEWVRGAGARFVRDYDLEIVDNFEWLYPEDVDRAQVQESWRHAEQNKIMLQAKAEPGRVAEFEQWCKSKGMEMPVTDVVADNVPITPVTGINTSNNNESMAPIKLPKQSFTVSKLEAKHATDSIKVEQTDGPSDYAYLRRPLVADSSDSQRTAAVADEVEIVHAPVDDG
jgi:hypothetical protein